MDHVPWAKSPQDPLTAHKHAKEQQMIDHYHLAVQACEELLDLAIQFTQTGCEDADQMELLQRKTLDVFRKFKIKS